MRRLVSPFAISCIRFTPTTVPALLIAVAVGFLGTIVAASPAFSQMNPGRNVYFGEQHVHTSWSFDAFAFGDTVTGPEEFYQYALGRPTPHPGGFEQTITKPLDWA